MACPKHDVESFDPDANFCCKAAYWRDGGGLATAFVGGQAMFHDGTVAERQRNIVAAAAAQGREVHPVNPRYDRPANFGVLPSERKAKRRAVKKLWMTPTAPCGSK